jgi:hypothetical protein
MFIRIPAWLGIPIAINALLFFICVIGEIAMPFFREVFGAGRGKSAKPVDSPKSKK